MKIRSFIAFVALTLWALSAQAVKLDPAWEAARPLAALWTPQVAGAPVAVEILAKLEAALGEQDFRITAYAFDGEVPPGAASRAGAECKVWIARQALTTQSPDAVAFLLGHEIGHCALNHSGNLTQNRIASVTGGADAWDAEYDADAFGLQLAKQAGFSALGSVELLAGYPEDPHHASGIDRLRVLFAGQARAYKQLVNAEAATVAQAMQVSANGVLLLQ